MYEQRALGGICKICKDNMNIIKSNPPNLEDIKKAGLKPSFYTLFAYGNDLYNPGGWQIPNHLMVHEETHGLRQIVYTEDGEVLGVEGWWKMYLEDSRFRFDEELMAYKAQYQYFCRWKSNVRKQTEFLCNLAVELSSELYGNLIGVEDAMKAIAREEEKMI
jgi:hypothetical protein